jgi:hypothetical protein
MPGVTISESENIVRRAFSKMNLKVESLTVFLNVFQLSTQGENDKGRHGPFEQINAAEKNHH